MCFMMELNYNVYVIIKILLQNTVHDFATTLKDKQYNICIRLCFISFYYGYFHF